MLTTTTTTTDEAPVELREQLMTLDGWGMDRVMIFTDSVVATASLDGKVFVADGFTAAEALTQLVALVAGAAPQQPTP